MLIQPLLDKLVQLRLPAFRDGLQEQLAKAEASLRYLSRSVEIEQAPAVGLRSHEHDLRDALPLGVLEEQGDHLLAHVDPEHNPAVLGKGERHLP